MILLLLSYQSECHCAKTVASSISLSVVLSYQSECHCAKTFSQHCKPLSRLVTSQNVTAPKHDFAEPQERVSLVTSQNITAPKLGFQPVEGMAGLVTSQNVTAPKHLKPSSDGKRA